MISNIVYLQCRQDIVIKMVLRNHMNVWIEIVKVIACDYQNRVDWSQEYRKLRLYTNYILHSYNINSLGILFVLISL